MSDDTTTWAWIHAERGKLADTIEGLTPEQWGRQSLCAKWTIGQISAHILAGAEQTTGHFFKGMVGAGFRFDAAMDKEAKKLGQLSPAEIAARLRKRTTTTNHPPAPVLAMLGEVVVHGEDLRRPLGLAGSAPADAKNACLQMFTKANFPVGGKKRIAGLRLVATDTGWTYGDGPELSGPAASLLLAMTGRSAGLADLSGDGAASFAGRLGSAAAPAA